MKKVHTKRKIIVQWTKYMHADIFFRHLSFEWNYGINFPINPYLKQDPQPWHQWRSWKKVWGQKSSPESFNFLASNVKGKRSPRNEVAKGVNWTKESWDNAHVQINWPLILHLVLTSHIFVLLYDDCKQFFWYFKVLWFLKFLLKTYIWCNSWILIL